MTVILSKSFDNKCNKVATFWAGIRCLVSCSSQQYYLLIFQSSTALFQLIMNCYRISDSNNINITKFKLIKVCTLGKGALRRLAYIVYFNDMLVVGVSSFLVSH